MIERTAVLRPLAAGFVLAVSSHAGPVRAGEFDIGLQGSFGLGGEVETEFPDPYGGREQLDDDMEATVGFSVFGRYDVYRYVSVGAQANFLWWRSETMDDANIDRHTSIDIDAQIRGKYPFREDAMEVYLSVPVGLTIAIPSDEWEDAAGVQVDTGFGFNLSILAGFAYRFLESFGAYVDLGWAYHSVSNDIDGVSSDVDTSVSQFSLNLGVFTSVL